MGVHLVVTPGDPRGIGPEVAHRAIERFGRESSTPVTCIGPEGPIGSADLEALCAEGRSRFTSDAAAGAYAAKAIETAVASALAGDVHGIVTAPLHKPSLHAAGWVVPGQTEMLARLAGVDRVGMLMAAERTRLDHPLRVLLATTHVALRDVPALVTADLLGVQIGLLHDALEADWGFESPRIAVCGMNPHASDGGLFGDEEARVFEPAIALACEAGMDVTGPLPADTVFSRALDGRFDAVVSPYHDVGMAAFKTVSFGTGVNVSIGLPFVRTSPDHGTAFDIAGTGSADSTSMLEALRLAGRLAATRFDTLVADV